MGWDDCPLEEAVALDTVEEEIEEAGGVADGLEEGAEAEAL